MLLEGYFTLYLVLQNWSARRFSSHIYPDIRRRKDRLKYFSINNRRVLFLVKT